MDLVNDVSKELQQQWPIGEAFHFWDQQLADCLKRIEATSAINAQTQDDMGNVANMMQQLRETQERLQDTFAAIDRLENVVQTVKQTYNQVAQSVDEMEKAVSASLQTSSVFPFRLASSSGASSVQPYFPPPKPVEIYHTSDLFPQ